jgi:hypothetical protein
VLAYFISVISYGGQREQVQTSIRFQFNLSENLNSGCNFHFRLIWFWGLYTVDVREFNFSLYRPTVNKPSCGPVAPHQAHIERVRLLRNDLRETYSYS